MKLEGALPVPRTSATVIAPTRRQSLDGRIIVDGYTPPEQPRNDRPTRVNGPVHCARCVKAGLIGEGHNSKNRQCPARKA